MDLRPTTESTTTAAQKTDFSENLVCEYFVSGYHIIQLRLASYRDLIDQKSFLSHICRLSIFCPKIKYTPIGCTVYPVKWTHVQLQSQLP